MAVKSWILKSDMIGAILNNRANLTSECSKLSSIPVAPCHRPFSYTPSTTQAKKPRTFHYDPSSLYEHQMGLNWNEIKSRALLFSKTWADACNEDSQAKPFWIDFFEIFGITNKRVATFELNVKKLGGAQGFVDLFWPGVLLVEHTSRFGAIPTRRIQ